MSADGPIQTLNGSGWVQLDNGTVYGEPLVAGSRCRGKIAGQVVQLASVTMNNAAGTVIGSGTYDLHSRQFQVNAHGNGIDIAKIERLRNAGTDVAGNLAFSLSGSGTFDDPHLNGHASLANLTVGGERFGEFDVVAHTANQNLIYDITSRLEAAELTAHGQTALRGDNETQATLNFSKFNIGALLQMAHINGLTGESNLEGTINVAGPLAQPEQMRGEARIQQLAVTIAGVHLQSEGGLHASMDNSQISLDPLHVTGEETDLYVQGSLNLTGKRQLDVAANGSINLKLAETVDPDLTARGTTTFRVEAHGPLDNPGLSGRIDFQDASLALEDLPNSLSQLHGTLEFNQNRLEVKSLTAMSGGGLLSVSGYLSLSARHLRRPCAEGEIDPHPLSAGCEFRGRYQPAIAGTAEQPAAERQCDDHAIHGEPGDGLCGADRAGRQGSADRPGQRAVESRAARRAHSIVAAVELPECLRQAGRRCGPDGFAAPLPRRRCWGGSRSPKAARPSRARATNCSAARLPSPTRCASSR